MRCKKNGCALLEGLAKQIQLCSPYWHIDAERMEQLRSEEFNVEEFLDLGGASGGNAAGVGVPKRKANPMKAMKAVAKRGAKKSSSSNVPAEDGGEKYTGEVVTGGNDAATIYSSAESQRLHISHDDYLDQAVKSARLLHMKAVEIRDSFEADGSMHCSFPPTHVEVSRAVANGSSGLQAKAGAKPKAQAMGKAKAKIETVLEPYNVEDRKNSRLNLGRLIRMFQRSESSWYSEMDLQILEQIVVMRNTSSFFWGGKLHGLLWGRNGGSVRCHSRKGVVEVSPVVVAGPRGRCHHRARRCRFDSPLKDGELVEISGGSPRSPGDLDDMAPPPCEGSGISA